MVHNIKRNEEMVKIKQVENHNLCLLPWEKRHALGQWSGLHSNSTQMSIYWYINWHTYLIFSSLWTCPKWSIMRRRAMARYACRELMYSRATSRSLRRPRKSSTRMAGTTLEILANGYRWVKTSQTIELEDVDVTSYNGK